MRKVFRFIARLIMLPHYFLDDFIKLDILPTKQALKDYLFKGYIGGSLR